MNQFNKPTSNPIGDTNDVFSQLVIKSNPGATALAYTSLGDEVSPGLFVLDRRAMLAAIAMHIFQDQTFLDEEAALMERKMAGDPIPLAEAQAIAQGLVERVSDRVELSTAIAMIPLNILVP